MNDTSYELIRKKGAKYHSKSNLWAKLCIERGVYLICRDKSQKARELSFDYVAYKASRLSEYAMQEGLYSYVWLAPMYGTIEGFRVMTRLIDVIEWHCQTRGLLCENMLCHELVDYEGFKVKVMIKDKPYEGTVERGGKYILYHYVRREDVKRARYIKPYELKSVELL